jgi:hypothetical protein
VDIEITVPAVDPAVLYHHEMALLEIEYMSPSRSYGAETSLRSWRRNLTAIKLNGTDGYAFKGHSLTAETSATLQLGALLIAVDISWAKARWYAGSYITPLKQRARLLKITAAGPELVVESRKKSWARDILGYLATHETLCLEAGIRVSET